MVDNKNTATKGWWMAGITGEAVIKKPCQLADTATMKIQNCSSPRHSQLSGSRFGSHPENEYR